jgi:hypothetical protein
VKFRQPADVIKRYYNLHPEGTFLKYSKTGNGSDRFFKDSLVVILFIIAIFSKKSMSGILFSFLDIIAHDRYAF